MAQRGGDRQTDKQTENLSILQDFVPYWGSCPKGGRGGGGGGGEEEEEEGEEENYKDKDKDKDKDY